MLRLFLQSFAASLILVAIVFAQLNPEIQKAIDEGDTETAVELLNAAVASDPSYHANYYWLGRIYFDGHRYPAAKEQFVLALDKKGNHYQSMYLLAQTLVKLGELEDAEKQINKGLKKAKNMKSVFENASGLLSLAREELPKG